MSGIVERLAALKRDAAEVFEESQRTGELVEAVLERWEEEALPAEAHLELVNAWLCLKKPGLTAVRRLMTTPPYWELVGARGIARVTSSQLAEWRYAKVKISDATGQVAERPKKWDPVWRAITNAAEDVDLGPLGTEAGQASEWIRAYLNWQSIQPSLATAAGMRQPHRIDESTVAIFATDLLKYLRRDLHERLDPKQLAVMLRAAGVSSRQVTVPTDHDEGERRTTATVYDVPG